MTASTDKGQDQIGFKDLIYQKPVRSNVAFAAAFPVARQIVVEIFGIELSAFGKSPDHVLDRLSIAAAPFHQLQVPLELRRRLDGILHFHKSSIIS